MTNENPVNTLSGIQAKRCTGNAAPRACLTDRKQQVARSPVEPHDVKWLKLAMPGTGMAAIDRRLLAMLNFTIHPESIFGMPAVMLLRCER
jgi:hypothetical protein